MRPLPPLARGALALVAGILVGLRAPMPADRYVAGITLVAAAFAVALLRRRSSLALPIAFAAVGITLGQTAAGTARFDCRTRIPDGARLTVRGELEATPRAGGPARLRLHDARLNGRIIDCSGTIRVGGIDRGRTATGAAARGPRAEPRSAAGGTERGDHVPPPAGAHIVGEGMWWASRPEGAWPRPPRWSGLLLLDSLRVVSPADRLRDPILSARGAAQRRLRTLFPDRSGLAEALILAERDGLDDEIRERFVRAGLVHVLAISGMHVGLIAGALLLIARILRLSPRMAVAGSVTIVLAYVAFIGAPAAATRAALQISLLSAARLAQRSADPFAVMAAAGIALAALDPLAVLSPGFQLSFLGAGGIIALRRPILGWMPAVGPRTLRDGLATSLAALAATMPVAALHFGRAAPVGALATLAAVPLVALAVPATALALLASLVWEPAGGFIAGAARVALGMLDRVAAGAAALPLGSMYVPRDTAVGWLVAGTLVFFLQRRGARMRRRVRRWVAAGAAVALLIAWPVLARGFTGDALEIHAIDVGQGDAIAIRSPAGRWMLVDAGPRTVSYDAGRARVVPFLLRHSVHRLDALIVTHPDADHIGGAPAVLEAIDVATIIAPGLPVGKSLYLSTLAAARERGARWIAARPGREIRWDGVRLTLLFPDSATVDDARDANNVSVVARLSYGRFAALLLGDAPADVERRLAREHGDALDVDLLKVAHHGSATSTSVALLRTARPELALISVGRRNRFGHPHPTVVRRLERHGVRTLRTDLAGSITVRAWPDGRLEVTTERSGGG